MIYLILDYQCRGALLREIAVALDISLEDVHDFMLDWLWRK